MLPKPFLGFDPALDSVITGKEFGLTAVAELVALEPARWMAFVWSFTAYRRAFIQQWNARKIVMLVQLNEVVYSSFRFDRGDVTAYV